MRAKDVQLNQKWKQNVFKYKKNEIRRRQYEKWQMLKNLQKLDTSDAEEFAKKKLNVNLLIIVVVQYCVNKKICWQTNIFEKSLDEFEIIDVKRQLNNVIEIQHDVEQK